MNATCQQECGAEYSVSLLKTRVKKRLFCSPHVSFDFSPGFSTGKKSIFYFIFCVVDFLNVQVVVLAAHNTQYIGLFDVFPLHFTSFKSNISSDGSSKSGFTSEDPKL